MKENSNTENQSEHFRDVMQRHSDEELVKVLKKRKHYQPEAAKQAVSEAISRGIINSEQDLFSDKFAEIPVKTRLYPEIENPEVRKKVKRSISRSLLLVGVIPLVWSLARWNINTLPVSLMVLSFGLVWIGISTGLLVTKNVRFAYGLLFLMVPGLIFLVRMLLQNRFLLAYEIVVPVVLTVLILYGVGYLHKLRE
jgi:hypothetical protein